MENNKQWDDKFISNLQMYKMLNSKNSKMKPYEVIKHGRETLGYSQEEFAELTGVKRSALSKYETGARKIPIILFFDLVEFISGEILKHQKNSK